MNIRKIILNDSLVRSRVFDARKPSKSKTELNINYGEIQTPPLLTPSPILLFYLFFFSCCGCQPDSLCARVPALKRDKVTHN